MIHLFRDRPWTDHDSALFLDDPRSMKMLDEAHVRGRQIVIRNGCKNGIWLAEVVAMLQRLGATKIILKSAYPRVAVLGARPRPKL